MFPEHALELETLIALADAAMYEVKRSGRNGYLVSGQASRAHDSMHGEVGQHRATRNGFLALGSKNCL